MLYNRNIHNFHRLRPCFQNHIYTDYIIFLLSYVCYPSLYICSYLYSLGSASSNKDFGIASFEIRSITTVIKIPLLYCSKPSLSTISNRKEGFTMDNNEKNATSSLLMERRRRATRIPIQN